MKEDDFRDGFVLALHVLSSMGHKPKFDDVVKQLVSVAQGELSLQPSPEEVIKEMEADVGKPLPDELKASIHGLQSTRARSDNANRRLAVRMLNAMGIEVD